MTFDETIKSLTPAFKHIAFIEPWTMGGKIGGNFTVYHSNDLPKVFGYVWKFHPDYDGPLNAGDLVFHPRYATELIRQGTQEVPGRSEPVNWELHAIDIDVIEAIVVRSEDAFTETAAEIGKKIDKKSSRKICDE